MAMLKLIALLLVPMVGINSCFAVPKRRAMLAGIYGQEQRYHVQKGKAVESRKEESKVQYADDSIDNHHNIPRQYYSDWSDTSRGESGDGSNGGSG
ncbi:hypothetical protein I3843_10G124600 [Carya illinoinensis]|nr:hypothetical protein I3843_10G124600 [Carya illinoinensis]